MGRTLGHSPEFMRESPCRRRDMRPSGTALLPQPAHHRKPLTLVQNPDPGWITGIQLPRLSKCTRSLLDQRSMVPDCGDEILSRFTVGSHAAMCIGA